MPTRRELPLAGDGTPVRERTDAARNRARILAAAGRLIDERGVGAVSMDDVAAEAGVGKGTLYRRFGDRAGLAWALLDDREQALQRAVLEGPPPLGPGAAPRQRLGAFLGALVEFLETHSGLALLSELGEPGERFHSRPYAFHRLHVMVLLKDVSPDIDAEYLADVVLAPLSAELYRYQRRDRGLTPERIKRGLETLAASVA